MLKISGSTFSYLHFQCLDACRKTRSKNIEGIAKINRPTMLKCWFPWYSVCNYGFRNPFKQLFYSLFVLSGSDGFKFLKGFYPDIKKTAYSDSPTLSDQLNSVFDLLDNNNHFKNKRISCQVRGVMLCFILKNNALHLTIFTPSIDLLNSSNICAFALMQEYLVAKLGIYCGPLLHISDSSFYSVSQLPSGPPENLIIFSHKNIKNKIRIKHDDVKLFDIDLRVFFSIYRKHGLQAVGDCVRWESDYFNELVMPMLSIYLVSKSHGNKEALKYIDYIIPDDWRFAVQYNLDTEDKFSINNSIIHTTN